MGGCYGKYLAESFSLFTRNERESKHFIPPMASSYGTSLSCLTTVTKGEIDLFGVYWWFIFSEIPISLISILNKKDVREVILVHHFHSIECLVYQSHLAYQFHQSQRYSNRLHRNGIGNKPFLHLSGSDLSHYTINIANFCPKLRLMRLKVTNRPWSHGRRKQRTSQSRERFVAGCCCAGRAQRGSQ